MAIQLIFDFEGKTIADCHQNHFNVGLIVSSIKQIFGDEYLPQYVIEEGWGVFVKYMSALDHGELKNSGLSPSEQQKKLKTYLENPAIKKIWEAVNERAMSQDEIYEFMETNKKSPVFTSLMKNGFEYFSYREE